MGVVYAARDERLERTVAVKTMSSLASDEVARKRFWREARAAASVNHPNVCQIYEIGEDERRALHRHGAARGRGALAAASPGPDCGLAGGAARPRDAGRALGPALPRHRPSRPEAVERVPDRARREAAGLRARAAGGGAVARHVHRRDARGDGARHAALHGARAGDRRGRGRPQRPVRGRRDPLRDAGGAAGVHGRVGRRDPARDTLRAAAGTDRIAGRGRRGPRDPPRDGQAAGRASVLGRGDGRGAARGRRRGRQRHGGAGAAADAAGRAALPRASLGSARRTSWPSACRMRSRRRLPASTRWSCDRAPPWPDSPARRRT